MTETEFYLAAFFASASREIKSMQKEINDTRKLLFQIADYFGVKQQSTTNDVDEEWAKFRQQIRDALDNPT